MVQFVELRKVVVGEEKTYGTPCGRFSYRLVQMLKANVVGPMRTRWITKGNADVESMWSMVNGQGFDSTLWTK